MPVRQSSRMLQEAEIRAKVLAKLALDSARIRHTEGVVAFALELAKAHGEDLEKAAIAAWLHDATKLDSLAENQMRIDRYYGQNESEKWPEKVLHAVAARAYAFQEAKVEDEDILNAILYHTTGRPGMSPLEKIIYIADFLEPGRKNVPEGLRALALIDLDRALFIILILTKKYLLEKKEPVVKLTDMAILYYKEKREGANDGTPTKNS